MPRPVQLAVMGAGLIGKRHIEHVLGQPDAELLAVVDPTPAAKVLAEEKRAAWFPSFAAMIAAGARPEGAIVATPNQLHVDNGLECVAAGVPALVEKPLADDVAAATRLVEAAEPVISQLRADSLTGLPVQHGGPARPVSCSQARAST